MLGIAASLMLAAATAGQARDNRPPPPLPVPPSGVIGMRDAYLSPEFWVARLQAADRPLVSAAAIDARNARLLRQDDSLHDLSALPATLPRARVAGWIAGLASPPARSLWDEHGAPVSRDTLDAIIANRALDAIPDRQPARFGMAVRRAALRTFPTGLRVFHGSDDADLDRFQESALFPGDPVAIVHSSADGLWRFVVSTRYAAWVEARHIAEGGREAVLGHGARTPYRVITGAQARTVFTPEAPRVSELRLDMGVRIPLADVPPDQPVNGQHPYTAWILDLPVRGAGGRLEFAPGLLQRNADSAPGYLPLTRANILRQSFKFLGERYGWGHDYNGRDCSGFVSEVYRSMGVLMPRNTGDQAASPVFERLALAPGDGRESRLAALRALDVGDLIYVPGHVMMYIGQVDGMPWVIHDINGGSYLDAAGELRAMRLNAVAITPLLPLRASKEQDLVDRITAIVRVASP